MRNVCVVVALVGVALGLPVSSAAPVRPGAEDPQT